MRNSWFSMRSLICNFYGTFLLLSNFTWITNFSVYSRQTSRYCAIFCLFNKLVSVMFYLFNMKLKQKTCRNWQKLSSYYYSKILDIHKVHIFSSTHGSTYFIFISSLTQNSAKIPLYFNKPRMVYNLMFYYSQFFLSLNFSHYVLKLKKKILDTDKITWYEKLTDQKCTN